MKSAFLFLVFLVAASATYIDDTTTVLGTGKTTGSPFGTIFGTTFGTTYGTTTFGTTTGKIADKEFLVRNKNILRLMNHVNTANTNMDQAAIAKEYRIDANLDKYTNVPAIKEFITLYRTSMLPKNKIFTITNDRHRDEAVSLFHALFFAKDFDTFYRTACWARDYVNEGMFVYAMTVAVIHRPDTRGMAMPPPYEIYPFYFVNAEVIQKAYRVRMQETVYDTKLANFFGIRKLDDKTFLINSNYSGWYTPTNDETALTYFTEDIGLNAYYFYFHATYPFWMGAQEFGMTMDRRGEFFLYTHQQLLARYYLERLSASMDEIPRFMWTKPIKTGFKSSLKHPNGMEFPSRPNHFNLFTEDNLWDLTTVDDYERRIRDTIDTGFIFTEDGRTLSMRKPEDVEKLGNIMQANMDSPNTRYYMLGSLVARKLLGNGDDTFNDYMTNPAVMEQYETALRDPMFYQLMQRFMHNFLKFKETLRPYTREEVAFPGVKIEDVVVDKLVTYFDTVDVDISNVLYRKQEEMKENRDHFMVLARQARLNHVPFNVKMDITSEKSTEAVVRIFLGPKYDSMYRKMDINENRVNFFEMDFFVYNLKTGRNTITRNSRDFLLTDADQTTTRDLFKKMTTCINGNEECLVDTTSTLKGFPDRLLLPRGRKAGMPFTFYIVVTPLRQTRTFDTFTTGTTKPTTTTTFTTTNFYTNKRFIDDNAFGYPLDRVIDTTTFYNTNMFMKDVTIFHKAGVQSNMSDRDTETTDTTRFMHTTNTMDSTHTLDHDSTTYDRLDTGTLDTNTKDTYTRTAGFNVW